MRAVRTAAGVGVAVLVGVVAAVGVGAGPASAHVTVNPREAMQGGYAKLAFRVPNERDDASTVKVEVHLPTGGADRVGVGQPDAWLDRRGGAGQADHPVEGRTTAR